MSWVRSAVNKAVEGGQTNLRRAVRNYADSVVLHASNAVVGGARIIQDRIVARNMRSFRHTVKRLEEVSVSCRGIERVQLLRRWLVALKEVERLTASATFTDTNAKDPYDQFLFDESKDSLAQQPTLIYYVDPDMVDEPKNFRHVFLFSQALEGITLSMILDAPNEEEFSLLLEIYGLCVQGGKQEHTALLSSVQDLAKVFSGYEDEVLVKREELLQYVQSAISGLKINADLMRVEVEACNLKEIIEKTKEMDQDENFEKSPEETTAVSIEALDEALAKIKMCSKLEELLLKKKYFTYGDSPEFHAEKVDKLKILSESLANSTAKAKNRISENRSQKEEALHFRVTKSDEVGQVEKELEAEIGELEKQKNELEDQLNKVNTLLASARVRLHNAKEEREHFEEASNEIIIHLKTKEDEMVRAITSYSEEANVVDTWIKFLESTWVFQISLAKEKEEQVNAELERFGDHFVNLVVQLLSSYQEKLGLSVTQIRILVENLKSSQGLEISSSVDNEGSKVVNQRKKLEGEYLDIESKFLATLNIVDTMNKQFHIQKNGIFRKDSDKVTELFDAIEKIKGEFESIERPKLELETPTESSETPSSQTTSRTFSPSSMANKHKQDGVINSLSIAGKSKLEIELDKLSEEDSAEEISEWEFDALDKDHHVRS
ncbi:intracellular protein transport protein USO1-like [Abrus precatorius]|uniref:Intracellular protein transport protein USO1-like n=1 Tax=Abrus precatorius TaxID=3816 RepID=A0A8B8M3A6_ABRPR|nr:intracellular protein transport protein USO1-like [Abrus precatorius]